MFNEWKAIFKKPLFIIVMIGVSLIPALYNVIFLSSMWNPYGKVSELPVAVVNKDKHATFNNNTLSVGDDMVKSLKRMMLWTFILYLKERLRRAWRKVIII